MNKIFGWLLLIIGVGIIIWILFFTYNIFNAKTSAPEIFKTEESLELETTIDLDIEEELEVEKILEEQLNQILPTDSIINLLNLISWSILAGIMIFGGGKISFIGIKLIGTESKKEEKNYNL